MDKLLFWVKQLNMITLHISRVFGNFAKKAFLANFQLKLRLLLHGIQKFLNCRAKSNS